MNAAQKIKTAFFLFAFGLCSQAQAQLDKVFERAVDRTTDRATQRVENKVNQKVNEKVDRTVDKNVDKVLNPKIGNNKSTPSKTTTPNTTGTTTTTTTTDKTSKTNPSSTTTTTTTDKTAADKGGATASTFVGSFQWEVKRYKNDKMMSNGHSMLAFLVKPYDVAVQDLDVETGDKLKTFIYERKNQQVVTVNESEGTASKAKHNAKSNSLSPTRGTETKKVDGHECIKYSAANEAWDVVLWVDESEKTELFNGFKTGVGVSRPDLDIIPILANIKSPVREAIILDKKKGEKTHMWLNSISTDAPNDKAFDYSRYEMR